MREIALQQLIRIAAVAAVVSGCISGLALFAADERDNSVTMRESSAGWRLLFDGKTTAGWTGLHGIPFPANSWAVEDGTLHTLPDSSGGDIMFVDLFNDFELEFDWKISKGGNSGVKYMVQEEWTNFSFRPDMTPEQRARSLRHAVGPEYQIIDDSQYEGHSTSKTGALYLLYANDDKKLNAPGLWNHSRVVVRGNHGEHWLNGEKLIEFEFGSDDMLARVEKTKLRQAPGFGRKGPGYIVLTHHNSLAWFRNIKIRELKE